MRGKFVAICVQPTGVTAFSGPCFFNLRSVRIQFIPILVKHLLNLRLQMRLLPRICDLGFTVFNLELVLPIRLRHYFGCHPPAGLAALLSVHLFRQQRFANLH